MSAGYFSRISSSGNRWGVVPFVDSGGVLEAGRYLDFHTADNSTADKVEQVVYPVDKSRKRELLAHCIKEENWFQVLVFSMMKVYFSK